MRLYARLTLNLLALGENPALPRRPTPGRDLLILRISAWLPDRQLLTVQVEVAISLRLRDLHGQPGVSSARCLHRPAPSVYLHAGCAHLRGRIRHRCSSTAAFPSHLP